MLVWMDLEMTGLDPLRNAIVEIATVVTDDDLQVVAEGPDLVVGTSQDQLDSMEQVVRDMHTRSGLLDAIAASHLNLDDAGSSDTRLHPLTRAGSPDRTSVRQLDRHRPALSGRPTSRHRELPPLPLHRRVHGEGALPALVPEGVQGCSTQTNFTQSA